MSTDDVSASGSQDEGFRPEVIVPPWKDPDRRRYRNAEEVRGVARDLAEQHVVVEVLAIQDGRVRVLDEKDYDQAMFMWEKGVLLTRREYREDVQRHFKGAYEVHSGGVAGIVKIVLPEDTSVASAINTLTLTEGVGIAGPNYVFHITSGGAGACPASDPVPAVADAPWPASECGDEFSGEGVRVVVVDTGFDEKTAASAPWLDGVTGDQEMVKPHDLGPYAGHGTFVAGVIRAMAPRASVTVRGFLTKGGAITDEALSAQLAAALADRPDIVSMSAGTYTMDNQCPMAFEDTWKKHADKRTLLVAAAGNDTTDRLFFPAAGSAAVGVGALTADGAGRAPYSNFGTNADVYAVGTGHVNAYPNGRYVYRHDQPPTRAADFTHWRASWDGTSFATPLVSGVIAARMSGRALTSNDAWDEVRALAQAQPVPGAGPAVTPAMACSPRPIVGDGTCCCCHCDCSPQGSAT